MNGQPVEFSALSQPGFQLRFKTLFNAQPNLTFCCKLDISHKQYRIETQEAFLQLFMSNKSNTFKHKHSDSEILVQ